ncbi:helix-turn-helix domain-containing protein [Fimbriiglobus ruber]|uniref:Transcriptional regulator, AraC family n=1 Tax=Fimbriiglobus ruber TaxID=1908690 RepID=A0A225DT38_9BACT|nr:helix-turn-helix domain-containing protein [Fimbriiglobus ruber]OWK44491.1 Transcriptional regulator, AraC family [Fimbriiglobus ruber]
MSSPDAVRRLFSLLAEPFTAETVFDCLVEVVFFVKNERAEYVVVNRTLAERCGLKDKRALLGKSAEQAFPPPLGRTFWEQDMRLLRTGKPVLNQLELHLYPTGMTGWCLTDKFPLRSADERVVGLVGVSHDLHQPNETAGEYESVAAAVKYAGDHLDRRLTADELGGVAGLSAYQVDQKIRHLFRLTTGQLLLKLRMDSAAEQLRDTNRAIVEIGLACGYADQSSFTRQFRLTTGLTPGEYRRTFRTTSGP